MRPSSMLKRQSFMSSGASSRAIAKSSLLREIKFGTFLGVILRKSSMASASARIRSTSASHLPGTRNWASARLTTAPWSWPSESSLRQVIFAVSHETPPERSSIEKSWRPRSRSRVWSENPALIEKAQPIPQCGAPWSSLALCEVRS